jgi:hypothetical protein
MAALISDGMGNYSATARVVWVVTSVDTHYLYLFLIYFHVISSEYLYSERKKREYKKKSISSLFFCFFFLLQSKLAIDSRLTFSSSLNILEIRKKKIQDGQDKKKKSFFFVSF